MSLIKKKRLLQIGFTQNIELSNGEFTVFDNREFRVTLVKGDKENPIIGIVNPVLSGNVSKGEIVFPGAYTVKDLKDIIFMYLGEDQYMEFSKDWTDPVQIVKIVKP